MEKPATKWAPKNQLQMELYMGVEPKNRGGPPKMDGENNGKPMKTLFSNGWFGG